MTLGETSVKALPREPNSVNSNAYVYRADGLRVSKSATGSASSQSSTRYRYDGQMGAEDVELNSSSGITAITRNALGARGIDAISRTTSTGTTVAYPLYDAHGNNIWGFVVAKR